MTIHDDVLHARIPRLGSITTGFGVEATSRRGGTYSQPARADSIVFHTNDGPAANALQVLYGCDIQTDSPTWEYDVVTGRREIDLLILPAGFRQSLEVWRAAECVRRCDGVRMSTVAGRPVDQPCACDAEMSRGQDRACTPTTVLPAFLDLDVERFGVWEIRSGSWGTAANLKGTIRALAMVGLQEASVPAVLTMVDRKVKDTKGEVHQASEFAVTIAQSRRGLAELAGRAVALDAPAPSLPAGDDRLRVALMDEWTDLHRIAAETGLRDDLAAEWRRRFGGQREFESLSVEELDGWVGWVRDLCPDGAESASAASEPAGDATPPEGPLSAGSDDEAAEDGTLPV